MTIKNTTGILLLLFAFICVRPNGGDTKPKPNPKPPITKDVLAEAFDAEERLCRQMAVDVANAIDAGELKTEREIQAKMELGRAAARKVAFRPVAEAENAIIGDGKWTPEKHSALLRRYGDALQTE